MSLFKKFTLNVKRFVAGIYDAEGIYIEGADTTIEIKTSVQPLPGKMLERLPEGRRDRESLLIFPETALSTGVGDANPDRVIYNSKEYEVYSVKDWQNGLISHYETIIQEVKAK